MAKPANATRSAASRATSPATSPARSRRDGDPAANEQRPATSPQSEQPPRWPPGKLPAHLKPPEIDRRFALYRFQWPGIVLLALIPLLALLGVFGEARATEEARAGDIVLRVDYIDRTRFERIGAMHITATNAGPAAIDTLTVAIDRAYIGRFSGVTITPSADEPFSIPLADVGAGESRRIHVELDAMRYGRHRGEVTATAGGADTARVAIATIVFP